MLREGNDHTIIFDLTVDFEYSPISDVSPNFEISITSTIDGLDEKQNHYGNYSYFDNGDYVNQTGVRLRNLTYPASFFDGPIWGTWTSFCVEVYFNNNWLEFSVDMRDDICHDILCESKFVKVDEGTTTDLFDFRQ